MSQPPQKENSNSNLEIFCPDCQAKISHQLISKLYDNNIIFCEFCGYQLQLKLAENLKKKEISSNIIIDRNSENEKIQERAKSLGQMHRSRDRR